MVTNSTPEQIVSPAEKVDLKGKLFSMCMNDEWGKVVKLYKENASATELKITISGDTALHIAVSAGKEEIVYELVKFISNEQDYKKALEIGNERGNTPLHVAASTGNVAMCECIARVNPSVLMGARNGDAETPFFLAVLNGKKEAFLSLQNLCSQENGILDHGYAYSRWRKDGDSILHCAIRRDYFGKFSLYLDVIKANFMRMPQRNSRWSSNVRVNGNQTNIKTLNMVPLSVEGCEDAVETLTD